MRLCKTGTLEDYYLQQATGIDPNRPDIVHNEPTSSDDPWEYALKARDVDLDAPPPREPPPDKEMERIFRRPQEDLAKYKIEIRISPEKNAKYADEVLARIDLWESGKMLAGGGDDHMFLCGYPDCGRPIAASFVGQPLDFKTLKTLTPRQRMIAAQGHWATCMHCEREGKNNHGKQVCSIEAVGYRLNRDTNKLVSGTRDLYLRDPITNAFYPCIKDCIIILATVPHIANILAKYWGHLEGNADIYLKRHALTLREQKQLSTFDQRALWDPADTLVIYPLANIIADTSAGAALTRRFEALLRA